MSMGQVIKLHIRSNIWQYVILLLVFGIGFAAGELKSLGIAPAAKNHLLQLLDSFIIREATGSPSSQLVLKNLVKQLQVTGLLWFLGLTVIGAPLVLGVIFARSFSLGFTIGFLMEHKGKTGLLLVLASILPQNLIYIPLLFLGALLSLNFSIFIVRGRYQVGLSLWRGFVSYTISMVLVASVSILGVLIESFACPWLLDQVLR